MTHFLCVTVFFHLKIVKYGTLHFVRLKNTNARYIQLHQGITNMKGRVK